MCRTAVAQHDHCPPGSRTFAPYGGIRMQLDAGDHLRMRLINRLPPVPADAIYAHGSVSDDERDARRESREHPYSWLDC